jgi:hypothetical protein
MSSHRAFVTAFALLLATSLPRVSQACSEGAPGPFWTFTRHPDFPLSPFAAGRLGVVQRSYARSYLVVAYMYLSGRSYSAQEQEAVLDLWERRIGPEAARGAASEPYQPDAAIDEWLAARKALGAAPPDVHLQAWRTTSDYVTYTNCPAAAFRMARDTLRTRAERYGPHDPRTLEWLRAQEIVFANCGGATGKSPLVPAPLATADPFRRADRYYQIAAAHFYAGNYAAAQAAFDAIADDTTSPWQSWGTYLSARALVRRASIGTSHSEQRESHLLDALERVDRVLDDAKLESLWRSARGMRRVIVYRLRPGALVHTMSRELLRSEQTPDLTDVLDSYTWALSAAENRARETYAPSSDWGVLVSALAGDDDDLTDWVLTFGALRPDDYGSQPDAETVKTVRPLARDRAVERWQRKRTLPWLLAALSWVEAGDPALPDLLTAARDVSLTSPGRPTLVHHLARLALDEGDTGRARLLLDDLLTAHTARLGPSDLNLLLDQRLRAARDLADFTAHLSRTIVGLGWDLTGEMPEGVDGAVLPSVSPLGAELLNGLPLSSLVQVATSADLPPAIRSEVATAAWAKAVVLSDPATLASLERDVRDLADRTAQQPESGRAFARIVSLLKTPHPPWVVPWTESSDWTPGSSPRGGGWWCPASEDSWERVRSTPPLFLEESAREAAASDWNRVRHAGSGPEFLARAAIRRSREAPSDPRVPQALHLAVAATRWACSSASVGDASQEAFHVLHRKYASSVWARRSKYWYAGRW